MDTFNDLFETLYNLSYFFQSAFEQYVVTNKQNAECSHFFGPLGIQDGHCPVQIKFPGLFQTLRATSTDLVALLIQTKIRYF